MKECFDVHEDVIRIAVHVGIVKLESLESLPDDKDKYQLAVVAEISRLKQRTASPAFWTPSLKVEVTSFEFTFLLPKDHSIRRLRW